MSHCGQLVRQNRVVQKHLENQGLPKPLRKLRFTRIIEEIKGSLKGTGQGKLKFRKENFQAGFVVAGGGFPSYCNHQLFNFEEEKRFEKNVVMKRER